MSYIATMDFIGELPPELVFSILVLLPLEDALACMLVCRAWYARIRGLGGYWRSAATSLGVAGHLRSLLSTKYESYRELVLAAWNSRRYVISTEPQVKYLTASYPPDVYFQCNFARFGVLVGTIYSNFLPEATTVEMLRPGTCSLKKTHELDPVGNGAQNRIVWANLYCDYLLLVTASGRWRGFNLALSKIILNWQGPTLYDSSIMFSCCDQCYMVAIVRLVSQRRPKESYWDVHLVQIGKGQIVPVHAHYRLDTPDLIPPLQAGYGCKKTALLSRSAKTDLDSFCSHHWLAIQWADTVFIYEVMLPLGLVSTPAKILNTGCSSAELAICLSSEKQKNTEFVLSADSQLLGLVFHDRLHVWNLPTLSKEVTTRSIRCRKTGGKVCLIALGHLYSLVGFESLEGRLNVISTYTGQVIFTIHGFSGLGMVGHNIRGTGIPPPYFTFLGAVDEQWLNSIDNNPHPSMPILLFWDKTRHCVGGIVLQHPNSTSTDIVPIAAPTEKQPKQKGWRRIMKLI